MHVIYSSKTLSRVHEEAGFQTVASGSVGFYDGFLTAAGRTTGKARRCIHQRICWMSNMSCEAWMRLGGGILTREVSRLSAHVFYVGESGSSAKLGFNRARGVGPPGVGVCSGKSLSVPAAGSGQKFVIFGGSGVPHEPAGLADRPSQGQRRLTVSSPHSGSGLFLPHLPKR